MPNIREKLIEKINTKLMALPWGQITPHTAEEIADSLIEEGFVTDNNVGSKWISVKDRLPDKHGTVYVCLLKFPESEQAFPYCLNWYEYGDNGYVNGRHFQDEGVCGLKVTHWMPLPEAPKGE